jgi:hypothetical protein
MKKLFSLYLLLFFSINTFAQTQQQLDSILKEADLMYRYEKVAWNASDLMTSDKKLMNSFGDYIVYHLEDTIIATFIDRSRKKQIAKYTFTSDNLKTPSKTDIQTTDLTAYEQTLFDIKYKIIDQLGDEKYQVSIPKGFSPNLILIKDQDTYRFYIIMGTSQPNIIPFGNDFLFQCDSKGMITYWTKFHSTLIPAQTQIDGNPIISAIHTHLKKTPYITATDICTFRLYADIYSLVEFSVLSTAENKKYTYTAATNKIDVSPLD